MPEKATDLGVKDTHDLDVLRTGLSAWLTLACDSGFPGPVTDIDLLGLRDWIDGGCVGDMPQPDGTPPPGGAARLHESMRVMWETRDWSAPQFRNALVEARLHQR
jgi:hypothetical protein